jgi:hypothetical protein
VNGFQFSLAKAGYTAWAGYRAGAAFESLDPAQQRLWLDVALAVLDAVVAGTRGLPIHRQMLVKDGFLVIAPMARGGRG